MRLRIMSHGLPPERVKGNPRLPNILKGTPPEVIVGQRAAEVPDLHASFRLPDPENPVISILYLGLDVHKDSITAAVLAPQATGR